MHNFLHYIQAIPAYKYILALAFIGVSTLVSIITEMAKPLLRRLERWLEAEGSHLTVGLLGLLSFTVAAAGDYLSVNPQSLGIVFSHSAEVMAAAVAIYHFGASKQYANIRQFLTDLQTTLSTGKLPEDVFKPKS